MRVLVWHIGELLVCMFWELPREVAKGFRCWAFHSWRHWFRDIYQNGVPMCRVWCDLCDSERFIGDGPEFVLRARPKRSAP